jgi:uncharacterized protein (DUF2141 family)
MRKKSSLSGQNKRKSKAMTLKLLAFLVSVAGLATFCAGSQAQAENYDLTVQVSGLHNYKGQVVLTLWPGWSEASKFPDASKMQLRDEHAAEVPCDLQKYGICRRRIDSPQDLTVSYTFKSIPAGNYAVFVFHDENNNGIFDTGLLKRPLEARGFSQILPEDIKPFQKRVPFQRAKFTLSGPITITIGLKYPPRP